MHIRFFFPATKLLLFPIAGRNCSSAYVIFLKNFRIFLAVCPKNAAKNDDLFLIPRFSHCSATIMIIPS